MSEWRLILPIETPSLNETKRMHRFVMKRLKAQWAAMLAIAGAKRVPPASGRRRVLVERHSPRELDYDNLVGGAKEVVVDNIKRLGLLIDDKPKHAELTYAHVKTEPGERPWTLVILADA